LQDYFDQSLDEIKLLRYVNAADPEDEHHIVRLYDFFYYKVCGSFPCGCCCCSLCCCLCCCCTLLGGGMSGCLVVSVVNFKE
jgi:hypothetical protein